MTKFKNSQMEVNFLHPEPSAVYQYVLQTVRHNDFRISHHMQATSVCLSVSLSVCLSVCLSVFPQQQFMF
jgi:hypothetical protein